MDGWMDESQWTICVSMDEYMRMHWSTNFFFSFGRRQHIIMYSKISIERKRETEIPQWIMQHGSLGLASKLKGRNRLKVGVRDRKTAFKNIRVRFFSFFLYIFRAVCVCVCVLSLLLKEILIRSMVLFTFWLCVYLCIDKLQKWTASCWFSVYWTWTTLDTTLFGDLFVHKRRKQDFCCCCRCCVVR